MNWQRALASLIGGGTRGREYITLEAASDRVIGRGSWFICIYYIRVHSVYTVVLSTCTAG